MVELAAILYLYRSNIYSDCIFQAGVSDKQLRDKETRDFIYDFINKHGGMNAVESDVQEPEQIMPTIQKSSYPLPKTPNENVPLNPPPVPARTIVNINFSIISTQKTKQNSSNNNFDTYYITLSVDYPSYKKCIENL